MPQAIHPEYRPSVTAVKYMGATEIPVTPTKLCAGSMTLRIAQPGLM
ncbi:MAG: hypothetical protein V3T71_04450 [Dehalococcoidia bacterium]